MHSLNSIWVALDRFNKLREYDMKIISTLFLGFMMLSTSLHAEVLNVKTVKVFSGSISNQALSVLSSKDQSGTQDNWSTYIEASPGSNRFVADFFFRTIKKETPEKIEIHVNTIGEDSRSQKWLIQLRDFSHGKWITMGSNQRARNWVWHHQVLSLNSQIANFISTRGVIRLRYRSNNDKDVSNIDQLQIKLVKAPSSRWWKPSPSEDLTWQWQINGRLNTHYDVDMYDVDLFDTSKQTIQSLKNAGKTVVCYFSAGTYEGWRPDWKRFFPFIKNEKYSGSRAPFAGKMSDWDERWLDIRRIDLLSGIMQSRLDLAVEKGCDGVEPDNMDAYTNGDETGLALSGYDQIVYNKWIARQAHARHLSVGLKNDVDQLAELVGDFDWALNEQCFQYNECDNYDVFVAANKAVFGVEYKGNPAVFCRNANARHFSWLKKKLSLGAWRIGCEDY